MNKVELFKCESLSLNKISKDSCVRRYNAVKNSALDELGPNPNPYVRSAYSDIANTPCRGCHVGKAHADGLPTPSWRCQRCGSGLKLGRCASCDAPKTPDGGIQPGYFECRECGKISKRHLPIQVFCGNSCRMKYNHRFIQKNNLAPIKCNECDVVFRPLTAVHKSCSHECQKKHSRKRIVSNYVKQKGDYRKRLAICPICGAEFHPTKPRQKYCGMKCYLVACRSRKQELYDIVSNSIKEPMIDFRTIFTEEMRADADKA